MTNASLGGPELDSAENTGNVDKDRLNKKNFTIASMTVQNDLALLLYEAVSTKIKEIIK